VKNGRDKARLKKKLVGKKSGASKGDVPFEIQVKFVDNYFKLKS